MLTLTQTKKLARDIPIVLYGSSYWKELINFEAMVPTSRKPCAATARCGG